MCFDGRWILKLSQLLFFISSFLLTPTASIASEWTAEEIADIYYESVQSIQTVDAQFHGYTTRDFPDDLVGEKIRTNEEGETVWLEDHRIWDVSTSRQYMQNTLLQINNGVVSYRTILGAYDGEKYRAYDPDPRKRRALGGIVEPFDAQFRISPWLPTFLGYHIAFGPERHLWELLKENDKVLSLREIDDESTVEVELNYTQGRDGKCRLIAEFDMKKGALPRRIELYRRDTETLIAVQIVDKFYEASPGVWVPVQMRNTVYYTEGKLPEGTTNADFKGMDAYERRKRGVKYMAKPIGKERGFYPSRFEIDTSSLVVNEKIDEDVFRLQFPEDLDVLDTFQDVPGE